MSLSACGQKANTERPTKEDIAAAKASATTYLTTMPEVEVVQVAYEDDMSVALAERYLEQDEGQHTTLTSKDVIELFADFKTGAQSPMDSLEPNTEYMRFPLVLTRSPKSGVWEVSHTGYTIGNAPPSTVSYVDPAPFTHRDMDAAAAQITAHYARLPGVTVQRIYYDAARGKAAAEEYLNGRIIDIAPDDILVLFCDFKTDDSEESTITLGANAQYEDWEFLFIPDPETGEWVIDDMGY